MKFLKILPVIFFVLLFACNKIDNPLKEANDSTCGDENDPIPIRKILVEDYTGHKCNNCPNAANILHEIKNKYCDHIIPIAIHVSGFAAPSEEPFNNDYRTDAGDELNNFYLVSNQGLPNGMVNRTEYNNDKIISPAEWETAVSLIYNITPDVDISIESNYNEDTKVITATISAEFLSDINYSMNLGLYLTEDSIISAQVFPDSINHNYTHRHMLRKGINGAFGESFVSSAKFGDIIEKTFTFDANADWNINHCELVAFISNSSTNEIIQAESSITSYQNYLTL